MDTGDFCDTVLSYKFELLQARIEAKFLETIVFSVNSTNSIFFSLISYLMMMMLGDKIFLLYIYNILRQEWKQYFEEPEIFL